MHIGAFYERTDNLSYTPLISVITVTYNHEKYIGECIASVLKQTYCNWELIIVDDGSTDATGAIISNYNDPRIIYLEQPHVGPFELKATYNKGLESSNGELIAILEGDDFWPEDTLQEHVKSFEKEEACLSHGLALRTTPDGKPIGRCAVVPEEVRNNNPVGAVTKSLLLGQNFSHTSTIAIRREALLSIGGFRGSKSLPTIDIPTLLELGMIGRFVYVDKYLGYHRKHSKSVARVYSTDNASGYYQQLKQYVLQFYRDNCVEGVLCDISEQEIEKAWVAVINHIHLGQGREALSSRHWQKARKCFLRALRGPELSYRGAAVLGLISSTMHLNVLESALSLVVGHRLDDLSDNDGSI